MFKATKRPVELPLSCVADALHAQHIRVHAGRREGLLYARLAGGTAPPHRAACRRRPCRAPPPADAGAAHAIRNSIRPRMRAPPGSRARRAACAEGRKGGMRTRVAGLRSGCGAPHALGPRSASGCGDRGPPAGVEPSRCQISGSPERGPARCHVLEARARAAHGVGPAQHAARQGPACGARSCPYGGGSGRLWLPRRTLPAGIGRGARSPCAPPCKRIRPRLGGRRHERGRVRRRIASLARAASCRRAAHGRGASAGPARPGPEQ